MKPPAGKSGQDPPSRTRLKKQDQARKALGEALVALGPDQTAVLELPAELRAAIRLACRIRAHGARRRQMQYIGALLRQMDTDPLRRHLENIRRGDLEKAQAFKRIEAWRDTLQAGDDDVLEEILTVCPDADRQQLRQLTRNARRETRTGTGPAASRKLFRYLRKIAPFP